MRDDLKPWLALPALVLAIGVGCDNKQAASTDAGRAGPDTAQHESAGETTAPADDPARPTTGDPRPADPTPLVGGDHPTQPPTPTIDPQAQADAPMPIAHTPARTLDRSPFPEEGEDFRGPIAAPRLSDQDPFQNVVDPEDIPDVVPWEEAGQYLGYEITVEGRIVDIGQTRNADIFFLNFHVQWQGKFYMVIFDDLADTLDQSVEETFKGKLVQVQGLVEDHRGRPQIRILSMDQVTFVEVPDAQPE
ncbi:MAG: hypothetical protein ACIAXF_05270 [Phycisphaerales bacterium JB063]